MVGATDDDGGSNAYKIHIRKCDLVCVVGLFNKIKYVLLWGGLSTFRCFTYKIVILKPVKLHIFVLCSLVKLQKGRKASLVKTKCYPLILTKIHYLIVSS